MGTAISRALAGLTAIALLAACGSSSHSAAFTWLRPAPPPAGWRTITIPGGAAMAYPPSWRRIHGDPGTATAVLLDAGRRYIGYLNITPQQGAERLGNWRSFRVDHNGDEGDRDVKLLAAASGLRFRVGRGSCVRDSYATATGARYIEVACLVAGRNGAAVIVGAAPPSAWSRTAPQIERAISTFMP